MLVKKILKILIEIVTLYNILSLSLIIISFALIALIFFQRNSDEFSNAKNVFGPNHNTHDQVRITYIFLFLFVFHVFLLNIITNKSYKDFQIKKTCPQPQKTNQDDDEEYIKEIEEEEETWLEIEE